MKNLLKYLNTAAKICKEPLEGKKIQFTLGNESSDLDSTICSLALGYVQSHCFPDKQVIPIINVSRDNFLLRTENCYVLQQAEVPLDSLIYYDEVNFQEIITKNSVTVCLVDHHILAKQNAILAPYVSQIIDHRPIDNNHSWDVERVQIRIEQVGSCATLITDEILKIGETFLDKDLSYLLYQTIIFDTIALKPEKHKATLLDISVGRQLEKAYNFKEDRQQLFDKLWAVHNDISCLTPQQLLLKDLKLIGGVYVPGLPLLVEEYFNLDGSIEAVEDFANKHQVSCIVLVGLNATNGGVRRDMALFSTKIDDSLRKTLLKLIMNQKKEYQIEQRQTKHGDRVQLFHIYNVTISRKQLAVVIKDAWSIYTSSK